MFCRSCGKEIRDGAKFCPFCGAMVSAGGAANPSSLPSSPASWAPQPGAGGSGMAVPPSRRGAGKKKAGLIIGGAVAGVAVLGLIVAAVLGLFSSPKDRLGKAVVKTMAAYSAAGGALELPDGDRLSGKSTTQLEVTLDSVNAELAGEDWAALQGLGLRWGGGSNLEQRKMYGDLGLIWSEDELASVQLLLEDNILSASSRQFTRGASYGMNTETMGAELYRLGVQDDMIDVASLGFNLFDILDAAEADDETAKEVEKDIREANAALSNAVKVEETGRETIDVNGASVDAAAYHVTVPQSAIQEYLDALEPVVQTLDTMGGGFLEAMGVPQEELDALSGTEDSLYGELLQELRQWAETLGDLELDAYVSDGCLSALRYDGWHSGSRVQIGLYLGGGENYVDDLGLEVRADGKEVVVRSSGNHGAKDGVFSDETVIRIRSDDWDGDVRLSSVTCYDAKAGADNFQWTGRLDDGASDLWSLELEGSLSAGKDFLTLDGGKLSARLAGMRLFSVNLFYQTAPYDDTAVRHPSPTLLEDMDKETLPVIAASLEENTYDWIDELDEILSEHLPEGSVLGTIARMRVNEMKTWVRSAILGSSW